MLVSSVCAVAFYCQRCGRIHVHDVPYFNGGGILTLRCEACGCEQVKVTYNSARWLEFKVECIGCGTENVFVFSLKELRRMQMEKVYCRAEHFELGYIGRRSRILELLAFNQNEFNALHPHDGTNFIEKQQILLEALNRLQEMAERGNIVCPCGDGEIQAGIEGNSILLECCHCGGSRILKAESAEDLAGLGYGYELMLHNKGHVGESQTEKIS